MLDPDSTAKKSGGLFFEGSDPDLNTHDPYFFYRTFSTTFQPFLSSNIARKYLSLILSGRIRIHFFMIWILLNVRLHFFVSSRSILFMIRIQLFCMTRIHFFCMILIQLFYDPDPCYLYHPDPIFYDPDPCFLYDPDPIPCMIPIPLFLHDPDPILDALLLISADQTVYTYLTRVFSVCDRGDIFLVVLILDGNSETCCARMKENMSIWRKKQIK